MRNLFSSAIATAGALLVFTSPSLAAQGARHTITASANGASCAQPIAGNGPRCARYFPDSLKLTDAQNQSITRLRENFARDHASQFQQLRSYGQYGQSAGQTGSSAARSGAITVQGDSLRAALRAAQKMLDVQIEKTLTTGQLAFVKAGQGTKRGGKRKP
jgi:Spy/CpxP family protein refolding chaperone